VASFAKAAASAMTQGGETTKKAYASAFAKAAAAGDAASSILKLHKHVEAALRTASGMCHGPFW
jgi:hypothetical protein